MRVTLDRKHRNYSAVSNHLPSVGSPKSQTKATVASPSSRIRVKLKRETFLYQAFSKFTAKIALGIFVLSFFLNFQPSLPLKHPTVNAQETSQQTQVITPTQTETNFQLPHPGYISTVFSTYHPGIDIATGLGMPIKPLAAGVVVESGYNFWGLGLVVEVEHPGGLRSLYAHMGKIYVQKDKQVDVNDLLGEVGMTGNSSGPHTHLELFKNGHRIDPRPLLPEIRNYPQEQDFHVYNSATPSAVLIPASASATIKVDTVPEATREAENTFFESFSESTPEPIEETKDIKQEFAQKSLESILTVTKPTLSATPSAQPPKGGKVAFFNLNSILNIK